MSATRLLGALDDPKRVLPPVSGVGKTPEMGLKPAIHAALQECVALQEACAAEGYTGLDPHVDAALAFASQFPPDVLGKVSIDEVAAVNLYTMPSPFYSVLNGILREEDRSKIKPFLPYIRLLHSALAKMPHVKATVYRGVKADIHEKYPDGQRVVWWSLSSCTKEMKTLENPMFLGKTGARTMFAVTATVVDIQQFSAIKAESEMLLASGAQLKVTSHLDAGNGLHMIQLEETAIPMVLGQLMKILGIEAPAPTPTPPAPVPTPVPTPTPQPTPAPITIPAWMATLPASITDDVKAILVREKVDESTMLLLTAQDLQDLGIPLGPRKAFLAEIEARIKTGQKGSNNPAVAIRPFKQVTSLRVGPRNEYRCHGCGCGDEFQKTYLCIMSGAPATTKWCCEKHLPPALDGAAPLPTWAFDSSVLDSGVVVMNDFAPQLVPLIQKGLRHVLYTVTVKSAEDMGVLGASTSIVSLLVLRKGQSVSNDELLSKISGMTQMQSLDLPAGVITDAGLAALNGMTQMQSLDVDGAGGITDAGLTALNGMTQLQSLCLRSCSRITDAGLTSLKGMTQLRSLVISFSKLITDAGVTALNGMTQMQYLNLRGCELIAGAGLTALQGMTQMQSLNLSFCKLITDAGLTALKGMTQMQSLDLVSCRRITDAGLAALNGMTQMQSLNLNGCELIAGAGLTTLKGMTHMRSLNLKYCKLITDAGLISAVKGMTQMQELDLYDCMLITDAGLTAFRANGSCDRCVDCDCNVTFRVRDLRHTQCHFGASPACG